MREFIVKKFNIISSVLSLVIALLYVLKGIQTEFHIATYIIISMNLIYIPFIFIFKKNFFTGFCMVYSIVLIFLTAFEKTFLFNNFTPLFVACLVIAAKPKLMLLTLGIYFAAVSVAFALNEESTLLFLIHTTRSTWFISAITYMQGINVNRKSLILYDDEKQIIDQLCSGKMYQKEVTGFSENTIYRKLKAAKERNGCKSKEELLQRYKDEKENDYLK